MSRYRANPIEVDAYRIVEVRPNGSGTHCVLETGAVASANASMTAYYVPMEGDYWVVEPGDCEYIYPPDVFGQRYSPVF